MERELRLPHLMWKISLPLRVSYSKNKKLSLNLNIYRNTHHQILNKAKVQFAEDIQKQLVNIPKIPRVALTYIVYPPTSRRLDVSNICSIVDKFFSDVLVDRGILEDDNYDFLADVRYLFGCIDRENPRVDVYIIPSSEPKESNLMRISIDRETVAQLLTDYVNETLAIKEGHSILIDVEDVDVNIVADADVVAKPKTKPAAKAKAPAKVKEETPEPEPEVEEPESTEEQEELPFETSDEKAEDAKEEEPAKKSLFGGLQRPKNS